MRIRMKAYINQKNGQVRYHWPKHIMKAPCEIEANVNVKTIQKKGIFGGKMKWW